MTVTIEEKKKETKLNGYKRKKERKKERKIKEEGGDVLFTISSLFVREERSKVADTTTSGWILNTVSDVA